MQSLQTAVNVVAPMFLMLALGCLLRIGGLLDRGALERLNNVCFKVFLSLLLYYNIYTADVADVFNPRLLGFALLLQMAIWGILFLTVPRFEKSDKRRGAMIQGIGRTNFVIFGTAIGTALCGEGNIGPISLLVAAVVPFYNVLAVIVLEIFRGGRVRFKALARSVAANPYIIAAAAALATLLFGVRLPGFVESAVRDLTRCATPLTRLCWAACSISALCAATCARSPRPSSAGLRSFLRWRCRSVSWRAFAASSWSALSACSSRRRPPRRSTWRSRWTPTRIWPGIWWCSPPCFPY